MLTMMMMEFDLMTRSNDALDSLNHFPLAARSIDCDCSRWMYPIFVYLLLLSSVATAFVSVAEKLEVVWGEEVALLMVRFE
jgi:hypothetical protein